MTTLPAAEHSRSVVLITTGLEEYHMQLLRGMNAALDAHGLRRIVYLNTTYTNELPRDLVALLRHGDPLGVICTNLLEARHREELAELVRELRLPAVLVGAEAPGVPSVRGDNFTGMRALMAHLLDERGVRRPVFVRGIVHHQDSLDRERVFREELARRGLAADERLIIDGSFWYDTAHRALRELMADRRDFDAVVAANDSSARGCITALSDVGLRVPEDVLVTGFDNERDTLSWPQLTTVDQDMEGQGRAAAGHLARLLAGTAPAVPGITGSKLVVRDSTASGTLSDTERLEIAMQALATSHRRGSQQDAAVSLARALLVSADLAELVDAFSSCLEWLQLRRCFLVLRDDLCGDPAAMPPSFFSDGEAPAAEGLSFPVRLLLDCRDGVLHPLGEASADPFPAHRLLPDALRSQLDDGGLVVAPLVVGQRNYGSVLMERTDGAAVIETVHLDLARALDSVLKRLALEAHAAGLERTVSRRTQELRSEVASHRRTTASLHAEVATRRKAEQDLQAANAELRRMAMQDGLTGIANRSALDRHLAEHWSLQSRGGGRMTVLLVDVDHFKAYNDHLGHLAGDETLREVAECLSASVYRREDLVARYGGEEFAVVLSGAGPEAGATVAMRFQAALAVRGIRHPASPVASVVTASIGIAALRPARGSLPSEALATADRALYQAKAGGRNRTVLIEGTSLGVEV